MAASPSAMYFLAFAFLASTSLLFILWHCRMSRERRRVDSPRDIIDPSIIPIGGLTYLARGAPMFLIRSLPTHVFCSRHDGGGKAADSAKDTESTKLEDYDVELGGGRDQGPVDGTAGICSGIATNPSGAVQQHGCNHAKEAIGLQGAGVVAAAATAAARPQSLVAVQGSSSGGTQAGDMATAADEDCIICLSGYADGDVVKRLPCAHAYHAECIDVWLRKSATCPLCKHNLWEQGSADAMPLYMPLYLELTALHEESAARRISRSSRRSSASGSTQPVLAQRGSGPPFTPHTAGHGMMPSAAAASRHLAVSGRYRRRTSDPGVVSSSDVVDRASVA